jgi:hypothetical protein
VPDPLLLLQVFNMLSILSQPLCTSCCRFRVNLHNLTFTQLCQLMVRLFMDLKRMPRRALLFGDLGTESSRRAFKHACMQQRTWYGTFRLYFSLTAAIVSGVAPPSTKAFCGDTAAS